MAALAIEVLREGGVGRAETFAPCRLMPLVPATGDRRSAIPIITFVAAVLGAASAYAIQWYANVRAYPLNIGGRPSHAVPAFLVATFEGAILLGALGAFVGVLTALRLPALWHPVFEVAGFESATVDHIWIAVDMRDAGEARGQIERLLMELGAIHVRRVEPRT
jgi:hypothetical protein